jgi:hypothetical protein
MDGRVLVAADGRLRSEHYVAGGLACFTQLAGDGGYLSGCMEGVW